MHSRGEGEKPNAPPTKGRKVKMNKEQSYLGKWYGLCYWDLLDSREGTSPCRVGLASK